MSIERKSRGRVVASASLIFAFETASTRDVGYVKENCVPNITKAQTLHHQRNVIFFQNNVRYFKYRKRNILITENFIAMSNKVYRTYCFTVFYSDYSDC